MHGRIKYLRRAYLLSIILFTTNPECCYPFHVQLADAVETMGGSSELITMFNRVGATASIPTLKQHIHTISQKRHEGGVHCLLVDKAFTIASADNIDFLQSHAAVYCGSQHRSWHATSVQLVQPKPLSCQDISLRSDIDCINPSLNPSVETSSCTATSSQPASQLLSQSAECTFQPVVSASEEIAGDHHAFNAFCMTVPSLCLIHVVRVTRYHYSPCCSGPHCAH